MPEIQIVPLVRDVAGTAYYNREDVRRTRVFFYHCGVYVCTEHNMLVQVHRCVEQIRCSQYNVS